MNAIIQLVCITEFSMLRQQTETNSVRGNRINSTYRAFDHIAVAFSTAFTELLRCGVHVNT